MITFKQLTPAGIAVAWTSWILLVLAGCERPADPGDKDSRSPLESPLARNFDPAATGRIKGQVLWEGTVPRPKPFRAPVSPRSEVKPGPFFDWPNPHAPHVDAATHGVEGAILTLTGIDPRQSKPWDKGPVRLELREYQIHFLQGDSQSGIGIIQKGDSVELISRQNDFHSLRIDGPTLFTIPFPDPQCVVSRQFTESGLYELSSAAGYFWMRGYLVVMEHPYCVRTDSQGRFDLTQVPKGTYHLECWMPNWNVKSYDRDPETSNWSRIAFYRAMTLSQPVTVEPGKSTAVHFQVSMSCFEGS